MNSTLRLFFTFSALSAVVAVAHAKIERVVEKTFAVSAAGTLRIETQGGEIRVVRGDDATVKITARQKIRTNSEAEADELLKKLDLSLEQSGNDVTAVAKYEKRAFGINVGSWPPVAVDFIVAVPASFATDLNTSGGGITVADLAGRVKARTSGGSIKMGKIGAPVDARTSGGSIHLDGANGDVSLETSGGNITVGRVEGKADLSTSGGGIKIESVVNTLRAHTSGGSITAGLTGTLKDDASLSTSGGSIRVNLDKSVAFRLDASTSGGSVDAEGLTMTIEKSGSGRSRLAGAVNGGGPVLKLRTSGGDIVVRTR